MPKFQVNWQIQSKGVPKFSPHQCSLKERFAGICGLQEKALQRLKAKTKKLFFFRKNKNKVYVLMMFEFERTLVEWYKIIIILIITKVQLMWTTTSGKTNTKIRYLSEEWLYPVLAPHIFAAHLFKRCGSHFYLMKNIRDGYSFTWPELYRPLGLPGVRKHNHMYLICLELDAFFFKIKCNRLLLYFGTYDV